MCSRGSRARTRARAARRRCRPAARCRRRSRTDPAARPAPADGRAAPRLPGWCRTAEHDAAGRARSRGRSGNGGGVQQRRNGSGGSSCNGGNGSDRTANRTDTAGTRCLRARFLARVFHGSVKPGLRASRARTTLSAVRPLIVEEMCFTSSQAIFMRRFPPYAVRRTCRRRSRRASERVSRSWRRFPRRWRRSAPGGSRFRSCACSRWLRRRRRGVGGGASPGRSTRAGNRSDSASPSAITLARQSGISPSAVSLRGEPARSACSADSRRMRSSAQAKPAKQRSATARAGRRSRIREFEVHTRAPDAGNTRVRSRRRVPAGIRSRFRASGGRQLPLVVAAGPSFRGNGAVRAADSRWAAASRLRLRGFARLRRLAGHAAVIAEGAGRLSPARITMTTRRLASRPGDRVIGLRGPEFAEADHREPRRLDAAARKKMHDARGARGRQLPVRREVARVDRLVVGVAFDAHRVRILGERGGETRRAPGMPCWTAWRRRWRTGCRCGLRLRARTHGGAPPPGWRRPAAAAPVRVRRRRAPAAGGTDDPWPSASRLSPDTAPCSRRRSGRRCGWPRASCAADRRSSTAAR